MTTTPPVAAAPSSPSSMALAPAMEGVELYRRPWVFYALSISIPWLLWFTAGFISRQPEQSAVTRVVITVLAFAGLAAPVAVAWWMVQSSPRLKADALSRLAGFRGASVGSILLSIFLLPGALLLATALSVLFFGGDPAQFRFTETSSILVGTVPGWMTLALAPLLEELAWHSYGTDSLLTKWSLWRTTVVFAVFWMLWHLPLSTIKGTYQAEVVDIGPLASANFFFSIFPFMILMNWLYFRCKRNIWICVVFHLAANFGNEIFQTHPDTKVIQTALLIIPCAWVLWRERQLFFTKPERS